MRKIEIKINNVFDWTELNPAVGVLGLDKAVLVLEREQNQIFKRLTFQGTLTFTDKEDNGLNVFSEVSMLNLSVVTERTWVLLRVTLDDVVWYGYFTPRNCKWDYNRKTFSVSPKTDDVYEPFLTTKYEINLANETSYKVEYWSGAGLETGLTEWAKLWRNAIQKVITGNNWSSQFVLDGLTTSFFDDVNNPVTGKPNVYNNMMLAQKTNVTKYGEAGLVEASLQMFSFEYAMDICRKVFNVWWDLEYVGQSSQDLPIYNFVLEHYSYFDTVGDTIDLKETTGMAATDKFFYDEDNVPKRVTIRSDGEDLRTIDYLSGLTGDEKELSIQNYSGIVWLSVKGFSTSDDGFFLHRLSDPEHPLNWDFQAGSVFLSDAMADFWLYGREYYYGRLNNVLNFVSESVTPSILQDVNIKKCKAFGANDVFETELSDLLGELGRIKKCEYRFNGGTALTLAYSKDPDSLITLNITIYPSKSHANTDLLKYSWKMYPPIIDDVRINILITHTDATTRCINDTQSGNVNGGIRTIITSQVGKEIESILVFLDPPAGYQIQSNVPLEIAEVCI